VPRSYFGSVMAAPLLSVAPLSLGGLYQTDLGHVDVSQWAVDRLANVREWDGPAVLLPLTAFDRGEARRSMPPCRRRQTL
jgi:hypothetical protein